MTNLSRLLEDEPYDSSHRRDNDDMRVRNALRADIRPEVEALQARVRTLEDEAEVLKAKAGEFEPEGIYLPLSLREATKDLPAAQLAVVADWYWRSTGVIKVFQERAEQARATLEGKDEDHDRVSVRLWRWEQAASITGPPLTISHVVLGKRLAEELGGEGSLAD